MVFDFSDYDRLPWEAAQFVGGRCFVDGIEIGLVWYVDTELGVVRSYDVCGDGKPHSGPDRPEGCDVGAQLMHGVWSIEQRGRVELQPAK